MRVHAHSKLAAAFGLCTIFFTATDVSRAQEEIVIGERISIHSEVLGEERTVRVGTPRGYEQSDERFPVLFVLDGEVHFHHTTGVAGFLAGNEFVPGLIVVAIENTDRTRDMTPPAEDPDSDIAAQMPSQGGAENFRTFLADELIPWVEKNYRTRPYRILVGHSLGGLLAIDTLISKPDMFNGYIAISPSLQWDGQSILPRAEAFFERTPAMNAALYMTVANEGRGLLGGVRKLAGVLDEKAPKGFEWHFEHMPEETHGSVPLKSTYLGLEFIYSSWILRDPLETYRRYGLEAIDEFYAESGRKYGYERSVPEATVADIGGSLIEAEQWDELYDLLMHYRDAVQAPPPPLMRLAGGLQSSGDQTRAIEIYRQILSRYPDFAPAREALAELEPETATP